MTPVPAVEHRTYRSSGGVELPIDVYRPELNTQRSAVLILHGGGWRAGSKQLVADRAQALATHGFTCVAANYRLLDSAPWPAQLVDVASALRWIRTRADALDVDPELTAVQGHSAGGHLALMSGTFERGERPSAISAFYPPIGFHASMLPKLDPGMRQRPMPDAAGRLPSWMLLGSEASSADLVSSSPIDAVGSGFPPTVVLHGSADVAIRADSSTALYQRLAQAGVPCELHLYSGADHEFDRAPHMTRVTAAAVASFLERVVTKRAVLDAEARRFPFPPAQDTSTI